MCMDRKIVVFIMIMAMSVLVSLPTSAANPQSTSLTLTQFRQLVPDLRKGGYVLYFRHASTDHNYPDEWPVDLTDCESQRVLTPAGRKLAKNIGRVIKKLQLPIGQVFSSPFCRCIDTAKLIFDKVDSSDKLYFAMGLTAAEKKARGSQLRDMLKTPPAAGKNKVLISHTANLAEAVGLWPRPEGVMFIFLPDGSGKFKHLGHVHPQLWMKLDPATAAGR